MNLKCEKKNPKRSGKKAGTAHGKKSRAIDLKELRKQQKKNFEERLKFIDAYVEWLKRTPNKVWSRQQNVIINQGL